MKTPHPVQSYLSYSLATAHRKVHISLTRRLKQFGVQVEAWRVMEILEAGESHTMGDLADLVLMNPPTLTKLVDRMVADGLVHRRVLAADHRKINLDITSLGRKRIDQVRAEARHEEAQIAEKIGAQRADLLKTILIELGAADTAYPNGEKS